MPIYISSFPLECRFSSRTPRARARTLLIVLAWLFASPYTMTQGHIHYFFMKDGRKMRDKEKEKT